MLSKISLAISVVALAIAGYLFFKKPQSSPLIDASTGAEVKVAEAFSGEEGPREEGPRPVVLAYINGDTLNERYAFIVEKSEQLESKMKAAEAKVQKEYVARQSELERLMKYAETNPNMSASEQNAIRGDIARMENEMAQIQEREMGALQKKEAELQKDLQKRVSDYLTVYAKQKGIDYVINHQSALQLVLYGSPAYDITSEVLAGLNAEYAKEKELKK